MKKIIPVVIMALVVTACSGISEEEHDAALADVERLEEEKGSLEGQLSDLESDLASSERSVAGLEDDLAASEEALAEAEALSDQLANAPEAPSLPAAVLLTVLGRGELRCGVTPELLGFSEFIDDDTSVGFDADYCRAVAAAVLGDADAVEYVPLFANERFAAIRNGQVDVLFRISTWTLNRDAALGELVDFGPTTFYDGQQFMGWSGEWSTSSAGADLDGARVCTALDNGDAAVAYAAEHGASVQVVTVPTLEDGIGSSSCDLITADGILLAHIREQAVRDGRVGDGELAIFPVAPITREPLGPVYNQGDTVWGDIVDWVVYSTIIAAEKGITSSNINDVVWDAEATRLFEGDLPTLLGLEPGAFHRVVMEVGNYIEIFDRHLGALGYPTVGSPNALWTDGGLLYAPPAR